MVDHLNQAQARFLWLGQQLNKIWNSVSWEKVTRPFRVGGLGIRSIESVNAAAMAHSVWRFPTGPEAIWMRILTHKYLKNHSFE